MNIFDQYGIKEVADVTLYSIHKKQDGSGDVYYVPALYLDTLKVSTTEQTGENTWARGGHGNAKLISWDYNKEITINLEDALCTPAELGMCYNGILSADWKDAKVNLTTNVCGCQNPVGKISRMEKAIYPRSSNDPDEHVISNLLPRVESDKVVLDTLTKSEVVDGTRIQGTGMTNGKSYRWRLIVESGVRSVAQVPDRFFDTTGRSYPIDWNSKVSVFNMEAPAYGDFKDAIIYRINAKNDEISPKPYIIFDAWMDNHFANEEQDLTALSLQKYLTKYKENLSAHTLTDLYNEKGGTKVSTETENNIAYHQVAIKENETLSIANARFLAIVVDNNDNYKAFVTDATEDLINKTSSADIAWYTPKETVNVSQFKGLDMWIRFESINAMIYFMLTKYENDIISIVPAQRTQPPVKTQYSLIKYTRESSEDEWEIDTTYTPTWSDTQPTVPDPTTTTKFELKTREVDPKAVVGKDTTIIENYGDDAEARKFDGRLWAYVNPRTMQPYDDTYWFHQGEPYYVKSLTIAPKSKKLKANKITIKADQWPGMYMMVGETYIRNRDTGDDERMQIVVPLCKVKSDQTLTLQADGDPTTFNMSLEVANPKSGVMMEINTFEVAQKMKLDESNGCYYAVDGSSEVLSE